MIADQQPRWDAIHHFCQFLGHDSAVFIGTEELAKKFNSLVYYGSVRCIRRGYYECQLIPITINPQEMPDYEITDKYMELLEADIRQHPELWLWTHKRWTRTKEEWKERQQ
jgi:KDO2-lipid IV(A) lauroyltransferase